MKKLIVSSTMVTLLSTAALPAFAADSITVNGGNSGTINVTDNSTNTTNITNNYSIKLDDLNDSWAKDAIKDLVDKGILSGDENHHFHPHDLVKRAEFAKMVAKYFNLQTTSTTQDFKDVTPSDWFFNNVEAVKNYMPGYQFPSVSGSVYGDVYYFKPNEAAQRQDVATTLALLLNADGKLTFVSSDEAETILKDKFWKDQDRIAPDLRIYVASAIKAGLIKGDGNGRFRPDAGLKREEAATLLDRLQNDMAVVIGAPVPSAPSSVPVTPAPAPAPTAPTSSNTGN